MEIKRITIEESILVIDLFNKYRIFYKKPSDLLLAESYINERLGKEESVIYVALETENGHQVPAGFTQLYPKYSSLTAKKNWILNDLYVDVNYRKRGIGEALIRKAVDFARQKGAVFVQLETAVDNYTAQSLYEAIGFKRYQPEPGYLMYRLPV
jgi:ribosomal protein S18 acetylase RimI-like enzyme